MCALERSLLSFASVRIAFDRGTITIEGQPAGFDSGILPETLWDPRVRCYRAPASAYLPIRGVLSDADVRFADDVRYRVRALGRWTEPALRPYQETALSAWQLSGQRGLIALPTGSGKTRVALAAMARSGVSALCLVPTRVLLEQWCRELEGQYSGSVGCLGNGQRRLAPITVSTYASAEIHMAAIGNRFEMLVVDEAHNVTGSYLDTLSMSTAPLRLGLTATPPRDKARADRLSAALGPVVYQLAVEELTGSYLAPFDLVTVPIQLAPSERRRYDLETRVFRDVFVPFKRARPEAPWKEFVDEAGRSDRGRRALSAWRHSKRLLAYPAAKKAALRQILKKHRPARLLVFTWDNESAYRIAREFLIMPITCDIRRTERSDALDQFAQGKLRALVSSRVLNEGLDVPDADVAVVVGGSMGEREHLQRIGRLLRPAPGKRALVYELVCEGTSEVRQSRERRRALGPDQAPRA